MLGSEAMSEWGWRIPFLTAIPMVLVSSLVRKRVEESVAFQQFQQHSEPPKAPLKEVFGQHMPAVVKCCCCPSARTSATGSARSS